MPIVAVAPNDELVEKLRSNLSEVRARGGQLFVFADFIVATESVGEVTECVIPETDPLIAPIVFADVGVFPYRCWRTTSLCCAVPMWISRVTWRSQLQSSEFDYVKNFESNVTLGLK